MSFPQDYIDRMICYWQQKIPQHLSRETFSPMSYLPISFAIIARKKDIHCKKLKKNKKMLEKAIQVRGKLSLRMEFGARRTILRNDAGRVKVRNFNLFNVPGRNTHRTTIRNPKHQKPTITPRHPTPSPCQRRKDNSKRKLIRHDSNTTT